MLRVLNVIPSLGGGGAERQIVLLAEALRALNIDVHIAYMREGPNYELARLSAMGLHRLRVAGNHDPRALLELLSLIRVLRPALVQTWLLHADVFGGVAAQMAKVPWILSERTSALAYSRGIKYSLRRIIGRHADAVVANSESGLAYWRDIGFSGKTAVIRNIVVPPSPDATSTHAEHDRDEETILVVGRLADEKNPQMALAVLERVLSSRPRAEAHFLGAGPMEAELRDTVATSPALRGRIHFQGFVSNMESWYRRATVCLSTSRFEGSPNSLLEAMACGCPLVVSDIPAHLELLDSSCGWIAPAEDAEAMATVLIAALSKPEEAKQRSLIASRRLQGCEPEMIARQYKAMYLHLLNSRAPHSI